MAVKMKELVEVRREKKVFKITDEEFVRGDWIDIIKTKEPKPTKFEVLFKNNFLSILFYYKNEPEKGGEINANGRNGRRKDKD